MTILKIYKLDDEGKDALSTLPIGEHIIGRGILECNDKRVSRKHAVIKVTPNESTIEAVHVNPCFYMSANSTTVTILPKDKPTDLGDGDKFALLADAYWFRVRIVKSETGEEKQDFANTTAIKRTHANGDSGTESKRVKVTEDSLQSLMDNVDAIVQEDFASSTTELNRIKEEKISEGGDVLENNEGSLNSSPTTSSKNVKEEQVFDNECDEEESNQNKSNNTSTLKEKVSDSDGESNQPDSSTKLENEGEVDDSSKTKNEKEESSKKDDGATTSGNKPTDGKGKKQRRERCWYGQSCYRKNPLHKVDFSHQGDPDYDSDPNDDRPTCSFGAACYRRNRDHRREYKHPNPPAANPQKNTDTKKKRKAAAKKPKYTDTPEDDYDYEDPFIDDDSDEYEVSGDESDTDWEDSQDVEEDSQLTRRLVNEAKKFLKDRKN